MAQRQKMGPQSFTERPIRRDEVMRRQQEMYTKEKVQEQLDYQRIADAQDKYFQGLDPRRWKENADAGCIKEDRRAIANLPTEPIHREFVQTGFYSSPYNDALVYTGPLGDNDGY